MGELPLTETECIEYAPRMFVHIVGGEDVWAMMVSISAGASVRSVAGMYGVPESTVRTWLRRAKRELRAVGLDADAIAPRAGHQPPAAISTHHA
jgi:hypothetical protein